MIKDNTGLIEQALKSDLGKGTFDASLSDVSPRWALTSELHLTVADLGHPERD